MILVYLGRYLVCVTLLVLMGVPASLAALFDRSGRIMEWFATQYMRAVLFVCGVTLEVEGTENVPDAPVVFMSNHQSVFDIPALIAALPVSWRFVAKKELTWIPVVGWGLLLGGHIIIDRGNRVQSVASLRRASERIRGGVNVIIYPEGTRSLTGEIQPFKSGGFHLAIEARVPILPVTVSGSHRVARKRSLRINRGTVKVTFGKPIPTHDMALSDREMLKVRVRDAISQGFDPGLQRPLEEDAPVHDPSGARGSP